MDVAVPVLPRTTPSSRQSISHSPFGAAVGPDGARLYVADRYLSVVDTAANTSIAAIPIGNDGPNAVAASRDGARIYVGYDSGVSAGSPLNPYINTQIVAMVDAATYATIASVDVGVAGGMAERQDGTWIYVTTGIHKDGRPQPREWLHRHDDRHHRQDHPLVEPPVVAGNVAVSPAAPDFCRTGRRRQLRGGVVDTKRDAAGHVIGRRASARRGAKS
jgi:YVTN family beta-propeller protein